MKECPNCAKDIEDNAIFCTYCGSEQVPPKTQMNIVSEPPPKRNLLYIAAVGMIIGSFLPWASLTSFLGTISIYGYQGDGIITAVIGLIVGLAALAYRNQNNKGLGLLILLLSIGAGLLAISKLFSVLRLNIDAETTMTLPGIGLFITGISAFLGFIGALSALSHETTHIKFENTNQ